MVFTRISHMRNICLLSHTRIYIHLYIHSGKCYILSPIILHRVKLWLVILVVRQHLIKMQLKMHPRPNTEAKFRD